MIYFDQSATTRPSPAAAAAVLHAMEADYGNPSSVHAAGIAARRLCEDARERILSALFLGRRGRGRLFFTGSGTEANNLALFGAAYAKARPVRNGSRGTVLLTDGEHASVSRTCEQLARDGFSVRVVPTVGGRLDLDALQAMLSPDILLCSFMLVNNETGAMYDVASAFRAVRAASPGAVLHCDAVQAFLKAKWTPASLGADMVTVSAHKIEGPKGVGALFVSEAVITAKKLVPQILGGGQENGFRSGTLNVPGIAGFGAAAAEGLALLDSRMLAARTVREVLEQRLSAVPGLSLNLPPEGGRLPNILNVTLPDIKSETMLNYLSGRGICVSAGSACSSHGKHASRPLVAFGLSEAAADCSLRISLNHTNTVGEAEELADALREGIGSLARIHP